jgi:hypothetical protein
MNRPIAYFGESALAFQVQTTHCFGDFAQATGQAEAMRWFSTEPLRA